MSRHFERRNRPAKSYPGPAAAGLAEAAKAAGCVTELMNELRRLLDEGWEDPSTKKRRYRGGRISPETAAGMGPGAALVAQLRAKMKDKEAKKV